MGGGSVVGGRLVVTSRRTDCRERLRLGRVAAVVLGDRSELRFDAAGSDRARNASTTSCSARPDGTIRPDADGVANMTPTTTRTTRLLSQALDAGLDVIADKPVSHDAAQARDLVARVRAAGRLFAVTHGYAAYPMTRLASRLVRDGEIGALRLVQVEYIQGGLAARIEDGPQTTRIRWLFDPSRSGLAQVMSAIGCHAQHLACFVTGRNVARVSAEVGTVVPGRRIADHVSALVEFDGGCKGTFTAFQAAAGAENDIRLRVYGERGMVDWSHRECSYLRVSIHGEPSRVIGRGDPGLPPEIIRAGRSPRGHPEGLLQAFANIYGEVAQERMALALGDERPSFVYPASKTARTPWRSSRLASRRTPPAGGWPSPDRRSKGSGLISAHYRFCNYRICTVR